MPKRVRRNMVTRRVTVGRIIDVYKFGNGKIELLERIQVTGRPNEKELAKKYGVEKVMVDEVDTVKATYGLDIDTFMSQAVLLEDEEVAEDSEDSDNEVSTEAENKKRK